MKILISLWTTDDRPIGVINFLPKVTQAAIGWSKFTDILQILVFTGMAMILLKACSFLQSYATSATVDKDYWQSDAD